VYYFNEGYFFSALDYSLKCGQVLPVVRKTRFIECPEDPDFLDPEHPMVFSESLIGPFDHPNHKYSKQQ